MPIPDLEVPNLEMEVVKTIPDYLAAAGKWHEDHDKDGSGALSGLWYRGASKEYGSLVPGVYREDFADRARSIFPHKDLEKSILRLERETLSQFRIKQLLCSLLRRGPLRCSHLAHLPASLS